jgi:type III secretion system chaperone SycN
MARIDEVISEFGRSIEVPDLAFNDEGVVDLEIDLIGELCLEREGDDLLVYLIRDYPQITSSLCRRAMGFCRVEENHPYRLYAGLIEDTRLLFAIRIKESDLDFQLLNEAFKLLEGLHDRLH